MFNDASTLVAFLLAGGSTYTLLYYVLCRFVFLFFFVYYLLLLSLSLRRVRRAVVLDAIVIDLNNVPTHVDSFSLFLVWTLHLLLMVGKRFLLLSFPCEKKCLLCRRRTGGLSDHKG